MRLLWENLYDTFLSCNITSPCTNGSYQAINIFSGLYTYMLISYLDNLQLTPGVLAYPHLRIQFVKEELINYKDGFYDDAVFVSCSKGNLNKNKQTMTLDDVCFVVYQILQHSCLIQYEQQMLTGVTFTTTLVFNNWNVAMR